VRLFWFRDAGSGIPKHSGLYERMAVMQSEISVIIIIFGAGLVIGLATGLRNHFGNWLAGLLLRRSRFSRNTLVEFEDGFAWVQETRALNAVLLTRDRRYRIVPNRFLHNSGVRKYSSRDIVVRIPIADDMAGHKTDKKGSTICVASQLNDVMTQAPALGAVEEVDEGAVKFTAHVWMGSSDDSFVKIKSELMLETWKRMNAAGFAIPVPTASRPTLH
jgi:small-conductance mechanosensitive channel